MSQSSGNDLYASMNAKCHLSFNHFGRLRTFRDDAIVVSAGKLRKLWDSQSELLSSLCKRGLETPPALLPVKTAQFTQFIRQV
jgi:hypothetical protein